MATKPRHLKTAIQLWVGDQRKAGGYSSKDLADWTGVTVDTARGWESRGRPSEDALAILERKFGRQAPRGEGLAAVGDPAALISAMTGALLAQTQALTDLRADLVEARDAARSEREAMTKMLARLEARLAELQPPGGRGSAAADQASGHR